MVKLESPGGLFTHDDMKCGHVWDQDATGQMLKMYSGINNFKKIPLIKHQLNMSQSSQFETEYPTETVNRGQTLQMSPKI